ncbi:MAG TPA: hypothetical protein VKZ60_07645 [Chloroflexota bacterium]|nr:hypothetical protein [Chloroflexota bacterium]
MRKLFPLLLVGGLLHLAPVAAQAQQLCSASTAPTVRNPGYPSSLPYSNATGRVTSNCTGPSVDLNIQPDPYYGTAFIPAYQADPASGQMDPYAYARLVGAIPLSTTAPYDPYAVAPSAYPPYASGPYGYLPASYIPYVDPYLRYLAASPNPLCGPGGCGDLGNLGWGQIIQPYPTPWGAAPGYTPYPYWGPR